MSIAFNQNSEKPRFIFKPNPLDALAFQVFECTRGRADYEPVGDYIVVDDAEPRELSEKKVANLVGLMNGRGNTVDLSADTDVRTLFQLKPKRVSTNETQIIFRTYDGNGVSKENAVFKIKGGIFNG